MKKFVLLSLLVCGFLLNADVFAQGDKPAPSPTATFSQKVGLTDVTIVYSRPGKKDRVIFAEDGLVPFGKPWRTGANAATKFSFGDAVKLGGVSLEAGDYAILTVPGPEEWEVKLYPYAAGGWSSYVEKEPAASFSVEAQEMEGVTVETFMININNVRDTSAMIGLIWENTYVGIPLEVSL